jgi:uracil-DNA glycosylase
MKTTDKIKCVNFPCKDIDKNGYIIPPTDIDVTKIKMLMITEAPPPDKTDYFYAAGNPFYLQTVIQAFKDAGADVSTMQDILGLGVYITTAIKCPKTALTISLETMNNCSTLLEKEVAMFPNIKVFFLGGDAAIKMMNGIWKKQTGKKVIPAGSTYKIRGEAYYFKDIRVIPSYTPAGKNFLIEKSKRHMVAEDILEALKAAGQPVR